MNDERVMILKMLREEKISVEEADALLQALDSRPEEETGFGAGTDRSEEPRDDDRRGSGRTKKKKKRGFDIEIDLGGLENLGEQLKETFGDLGKTLKESFADFPVFDGDFSMNFGNAKVEDEKSVTFPVGSVPELLLRNKWGDIEITGEDRDDIAIDARIMLWGVDEEQARQQLENLEILFDAETGELGYQSDSSTPALRVRINYRIRMPRGLPLRIENLSGDISVSRMEAGIDAKSLSGNIDLADCRGDLELNSKSGDITLISDSRNVRAVSISGDIRAELQISEEVSMSSVSGDLNLGMSAGNDADIKISTMSGDIAVEGDVQVDERKERKLKARLGEGGSPVSMKTTSGDVMFRAL
jgi:hypothetical protein